MAKSIPLPKLEDLPEVVVFHRSHPSDRQLLLHVPTSQSTGETYPVRLDIIEHKQWVDRLPNSQALRDRMTYDMHIAYYPHKCGTIMSLEDPDEIPWIRQAFGMARVARRESRVDSYFNSRNFKRKMMPMSNIRQSLRGGRFA